MPNTWHLTLSVLIGLCIDAGLTLAFIEWCWRKRQGGLSPFSRQEMLRSLSLLPPNTVVMFVMAGYWAAIYHSAQSLTPRHLPWQLPYGIAAFLAVDFAYYWEHRCAHKLGVLWRLYHAVHHSSPDYNIATAYRVSFLNQILSPAFYLPLIWLGFDAKLVVACQLIVSHYQAWIHTERIGRLGLGDWLFNTPHNHRYHHSSAPRHRDRNLGGVLMVWDHLFGTYVSEPEQEALAYGVHGMPVPNQYLGLYLDTWRSVPVNQEQGGYCAANQPGHLEQQSVGSECNVD